MEFGKVDSSTIEALKMAESDDTTNSEVLQLGDLLQGAGGDPDTSLAYLHFTFDSATNATIIELAPQPDAPVMPARIMLAGINLTTLGAQDGDIISHLLSGHLHTDSN